MPIANDNELSRLLAGGRISTITVDTSVFDEKGLQLRSAVLQAVVRLKDLPFAFVLSGTVVREVRRHLEERTEDAFRSARKAIGAALHAFETQRPTRDELLALISGGQTAEAAAETRLQAYLLAAGCEILDDMARVDISTIFGAYFEGNPPFGSGSKKSEFPDALALNALEHTAADRQTGIIVVSKDKDWHKFCEGSAALYLVPDIERALALINNAPVVITEAVQTWLAEGSEGRIAVIAHLEPEVEQIEFSIDGSSISGELDAVASGVQLSSVEWPGKDELNIIEVIAPDDEVTNIVLSLPLQLKVIVSIDLNFSVWDSIDREFIRIGEKNVDVEQIIDELITIRFNVYGLGDENPHFDIIDVELDSGYQHIELENVEVFDAEDEHFEDS
jgi:hypothetical protein